MSFFMHRAVMFLHASNLQLLKKLWCQSCQNNKGLKTASIFRLTTLLFYMKAVIQECSTGAESNIKWPVCYIQVTQTKTFN